MYLDRLVELADKGALSAVPRHPCTRMRATGQARTPAQGKVPNPLNLPSGCNCGGPARYIDMRNR